MNFLQSGGGNGTAQLLQLADQFGPQPDCLVRIAANRPQQQWTDGFRGDWQVYPGAGYVVAFAAACYGYYILPTYPSDLAAIQFDRSGTTHIGKYVINHSFILPGLIGVSTSCVAGYVIALAKGLI